MKEAKYTKPLTIVLTESMYQWIKELSESLKTSMGEIVRNIIEQNYNQDR